MPYGLVFVLPAPEGLANGPEGGAHVPLPVIGVFVQVCANAAFEFFQGKIPGNFFSEAVPLNQAFGVHFFSFSIWLVERKRGATI